MAKSSIGFTVTLGLGGQPGQTSWSKRHSHVRNQWKSCLGRCRWHHSMANQYSQKGCCRNQVTVRWKPGASRFKGQFIWQSFDHPTDALLVGQSLRVGVTKFVSRASVKENVDDPYSVVLEPKRLAMHYQIKFGWFFPYFTTSQTFSTHSPLQYVNFSCVPEAYHAFSLNLEFSGGFFYTLTRPKYSTTLSFLRLGIDGNLRIYTFNDNVVRDASEETFTFFSRDSDWESECQLPERCGKFGLCKENQCVACPSEKGMLGWSEECQPKKITSCGVNDFYYYKIEEVDHYMDKYTNGIGSINLNDCGKNCTADCKCLGYFYDKETSTCLIAYDLKTLTKVLKSTLLGYIKVPNK